MLKIKVYTLDPPVGHQWKFSDGLQVALQSSRIDIITDKKIQCIHVCFMIIWTPERYF